MARGSYAETLSAPLAAAYKNISPAAEFIGINVCAGTEKCTGRYSIINLSRSGDEHVDISQLRVVSDADDVAAVRSDRANKWPHVVPMIFIKGMAPFKRTFRTMHRRRLLGVVALFAAAQAHADRVTIDIRGLSGDQLDAARANVALQQYVDRDVTAAEVEQLYSQANRQITRSLQPFGYYNAKVSGDLQHDGNVFHAVINVDRGDPVRVESESVQVHGPAADDEAVRKAVGDFKPAVGEQLDDQQYEQSKGRIDSALRAQGYLQAKLVQHRVAVTASANTAAIEDQWQSGPRFHFGAVHFSEAQFSETFLQRYVPWKPGALYSEKELFELQQRLVDADYFASVSVQPDLKNASDAVVPIDVLLVPAKRSVYSGKLYYSTDTGPGTELTFDRRWLNSRGHKVGAKVDYAQRLREFSTTYGIPLPGPNQVGYNFGADYREEETATSRSRNSQLAASRSESWRGFTRTLGFKLITGDFDIGSTHGTSDLLFAEGALSRKRADSLLFTHNGSSLTIALRVGPEKAISDTRFAQIRADEKWIHSTSERDRIILRGALGAMTVNDFDRLPPILRFFAGGDRSIRGFGYQQIGETNAAGDVIGGKFLAVASAEYERYFLPKWGVATFVDAGDAFSTSFSTNVGAGIGLRWKSPIGLVRLDIAQGLVSELRKTWRIHVVIGPDF